MNDARRLWLDISVAVGLPIALSVVFLIDRMTTAAPRPADNSLPVQVVYDAAHQGRSKAARLGVVPTQIQKNKDGSTIPFDDMAHLLKTMGKGFDHFETVTTDMLANDPARLAQFDVLFLTCAAGGLEFRNNLRQFVENGGTLYASDWRFEVIKAAFPEFIDPTAEAMGTSQPQVDADVLDAGLKERIGPTIHLHFELDQWKTAAFSPKKATILIRGPFQKQLNRQDKTGVPSNGPLLASFKAGKGTVIFTSFHNEKQTSETEKKLLEYLVLRLINAEVDADIEKNLAQDGFAAQQPNLLNAPQGDPTLTKTYTLEKAGPLRFALGFRNDGAKLRLHIQSPNGKSHTRECTATTILDVPGAAPGVWTYTITALELPFPNFPFTATASEKK